MNNKKTALYIALGIAFVSITLLIVDYYLQNRYRIPESGLSKTNSANMYTSDSALPNNIFIEGFTVDTPVDVLKYVDDGEAYNISRNSIGFIYSTYCITELSTIAENCFLKVDVSLASDPELIYEESGFLNGFSLTYFAAKRGNYLMLAYRFNTGYERDILYATITNRPTTQELETCSNALRKMIMATRITSKEDMPEAEITDENYEYYEKYMDYDTYEQLMDATAPVHIRTTQRYTQRIYADEDYAQMRLTLRWMDTSVEPWELDLYDNLEENIYEPVSTEPGEYVYVIDNVKKGESFVFHFYWRNPGGIDIQQEEESAYEEYFYD